MNIKKANQFTTKRSDISEFVYQEIGLSKWESADLVNSVFQKIEDALLKGESVKLSGFGKFTTSNKPKRVGRNPKTGETVVIPPMRVLSFKPSAKLSGRVNSALSSTEGAHDEE